jgi:hypothetical protein
METLLVLAVLGLIIFIIVKILSAIKKGFHLASKETLNYLSIRKEPTLIRPLENYDFIAPRKYLVAYEGPPPIIKGGLYYMGSDHDRLTNYINDMDQHRVAAQNAAQNAINKFEYDHLLLIDQQRQLFRRVFQAKKYINNFRELEKLKPSLEHLPEKLRINIPAAPKYPTPNDIAKKYTLIPQNIATVIGKTLVNNGGVTNRGNIWGLVALAGFSTIRAYANMSKIKRVAEIARGEISTYAIEMNTVVKKLELLHREIVLVSGRLKNAEQEIQRIVAKVSEISPEVKYLAELSADMRANVEHLYCLMMFAEMHSRTTVQQQ